MAFFGLLGRRHERAGFSLYTSAVMAARQPFWYERLGVADTLDGRFDLIGLHVYLVIRQLQNAPKPGPELAQAVFDAMFSDMDLNLREMGVGDLSVGKRVKTMWEAFHGRANAYGAALDQGDATALAVALGRNVWRGAPPPEAPEALARIVLAADASLRAQPLAALAAGEVTFPPPEEAALAAPSTVTPEVP